MFADVAARVAGAIAKEKKKVANWARRHRVSFAKDAGLPSFMFIVKLLCDI
jgi:hypothetical protein